MAKKAAITNDTSEAELEQAGDLAKWARFARRHWGYVALGLVVGGVLGFLYYTRQKPLYQSFAQIVVIKKQGNPLPAGDDPSMRYYEDFLSTHQLILRSPKVISLVVKEDAFKELQSFKGNAYPVGAILAGFTVTREGRKEDTVGNNVLNLTFTGPDSHECGVVLELIIEAYRKFLSNTYKNVSNDTLVLINKVVTNLHKDIAEKTEAYAKFREDHPEVAAMFTNEGRSLQEGWVTRIQDRKLAMLLHKSELEGRVASLVAASKEGRAGEELLKQLSVVGTSTRSHDSREGEPGGGGMRFREQTFQLELKKKLLQSEFGPDHPQVKKVQIEIDLTREFYRDINSLLKNASMSDDDEDADPTNPITWHISTLNQEVADINFSMQAINKLLDTHKEEQKENAKAINEEKKLREAVERNDRLFAPLMAKLEEIQLIKDLGGFDAQAIADPGDGGKIFPMLTTIMPSACLLGALFGFGVAFLVDRADKSFHGPEEIRRRLGLSVLAHIPRILPDDELIRAAQESGGLDAALVTHHRSKSMEAEAFRGLRTALYFSTHGEGHKVIQITSPQASDGKSTLLANLAVSIAQSGRKVLVIDADLRKPRGHKIFSVSNDSGLASVINGEMEWQDAVKDTAVPGLSVMPSGPRPQNPAELLTSAAFASLLTVLGQKFDFVLVDTPPLLAVSDPAVVAPRVDGVLLAIRVGKQSRPVAERAKEILKTLGAHVLGVVVNGAGSRNEGTYGKYGYGYAAYKYSYGYGYGYDYGYRYDYDYSYGYQDYQSYTDEDENGAGRREKKVRERPDNERAPGTDSEPTEQIQPHRRKHKKRSSVMERLWRIVGGD